MSTKKGLRRRAPRKVGRRGGWVQPRATLSRFSNMMPYIFRLSQAAGISSDGSGNISGYSYNDPTGSFGNYTEHVNYLANLFTEMRIVRSQWHLTSTLPFSINESKETLNGVVALAIWTRTPSSLPSLTSVNQVLDNQPSKIWAICSDTSGRGIRMSARFNVVNYQLTTSTSTDYAGCPGGLMWYGSGLPVSTQCFFLHAEIFIQYRARS